MQACVGALTIIMWRQQQDEQHWNPDGTPVSYSYQGQYFAGIPPTAQQGQYFMAMPPPMFGLTGQHPAFGQQVAQQHTTHRYPHRPCPCDARADPALPLSAHRPAPTPP